MEAERRADPALLVVRVEEGPRARDAAPQEAGQEGRRGSPAHAQASAPVRPELES